MIAIASESADINSYGKFVFEITDKLGYVTTFDLINCSLITSLKDIAN